MPELAEVEYYRKQWLPGMGQHVEAVELHREKRIFRGQDVEVLERDLVGERMTKATTHGKQMLFVFGEKHWLGVHLGMTGKTSLAKATFIPEKHDHLVLYLKSGEALVFSDSRMFGRIRYASGEIAPNWWADLPPEILSESFTFEVMSLFLTRRSKAPIKGVLLMQEAFPGIGNWMADEILWRTGIHPATQAGAIGPKKRKELYKVLREVCEDAMRVIGTDWGTPPNDWLFNHRWKDGGFCPATGKPLRREEIGGRTTCWSPAQQTYRGKS